MSKFIQWHKNIFYNMLEKFNINSYQAAWMSWFKGLLMGALLVLLCGCNSYKLATLNNNQTYVDYIIPVSNDTKVDTINSFSDLRWKLRTDFQFRWDFAQYAMNQPYSFYWNNPRLEGIWRPYNRFDVYFYSNHFWNDWAFNYGWGWNNWGWNRSWYGWNRPYNPWNNWNNSWYNGPFNNQGYNVAWNSNRRNLNVAYINGPRGSRSIVNNTNNIENKIVRNYNKPRPNNTVINRIVNTFRDNNIKVNVNNRPVNRIENNNLNRNNNFVPTNNNSRPTRTYSPPPTFNSNSSNVRSSTSTRSTGTSRGGNSNRRN